MTSRESRYLLRKKGQKLMNNLVWLCDGCILSELKKAQYIKFEKGEDPEVIRNFDQVTDAFVKKIEIKISAPLSNPL